MSVSSPFGQLGPQRACITLICVTQPHVRRTRWKAGSEIIWRKMKTFEFVCIQNCSFVAKHGNPAMYD
jgi:hypothetical protein